MATDNASDVDLDSPHEGALTWWAWPAAVVVVAACYQMNAHGNGLISFVVAAVVCRFVIAPFCARTASGRLSAAVGLAFLGFLGYMLVMVALVKAGVIPDRSVDDYREETRAAVVDVRA